MHQKQRANAGSRGSSNSSCSTSSSEDVSVAGAQDEQYCRFSEA